MAHFVFNSLSSHSCFMGKEKSFSVAKRKKKKKKRKKKKERKKGKKKEKRNKKKKRKKEKRKNWGLLVENIKQTKNKEKQ